MTTNFKRLAATAGALALLTGSLTFAPAIAAESAGNIAEGKAIAFARNKGNCLACHMVEDGESPGNIGPPLIAMKVRYPDKSKLRAQIWDATAFNPESFMVPFGRLKVLTESEIDALVDYIWSL